MDWIKNGKMSTNAEAIHPAQDLINRVIDLQDRLEEFKPNVRNHVELQVEYNNADTKVADARTAIMGLVAEFNRLG